LGSNQRPLASEASTLSTELRARTGNLQRVTRKFRVGDCNREYRRSRIGRRSSGDRRKAPERHDFGAAGAGERVRGVAAAPVARPDLVAAADFEPGGGDAAGELAFGAQAETLGQIGH